MTAPISKPAVIAALDAWIRQRPGLEFGNYGDLKSYRAELRSIARDLRDARTLLRAVELSDSITAETILEAAKHAFSGRLSIIVGPTEGERLDGIRADQLPPVRIDYCTGQYFPTEYRRAVCAVMAACLWDYWRDAMPAPVERDVEVNRHGFTYKVDMYRMPGGKGLGSPDDYLRATAQRELGRTIAQRWFN